MTATWDLLGELGFVEDPDAITDTPPSLSYRRGGLVVFATRGTNKWYRDSIFLTGHENTARSLSRIESELPLAVKDLQQLCGFLRAVVSNREGLPWTGVGTSSDPKEE